MPKRGVCYCDGRATPNTVEMLYGGCSWLGSGSNSRDRTVKVFRGVAWFGRCESWRRDIVEM